MEKYKIERNSVQEVPHHPIVWPAALLTAVPRTLSGCHGGQADGEGGL